MSAHLKLIFSAAILAMCTFATARADRVSSDRADSVIDKGTREHSCHVSVTERSLALPASNNFDSKNGSFVLSSHALMGSGKSTGDLTIDRRRDDTDRMRLPAFVVSIPEPMTIALMATGLLGLGAALRKRV